MPLTVSGDHEVTAGAWCSLARVKTIRLDPSSVMMGSLASLGMPLSTDVVSGGTSR